MKVNNANGNMNWSRKNKIKMLLEYAKTSDKNGYKPTKRGIRKEFHLEIYNYFKNITDYYEKAGIEIPLRHHKKENVRALLTEYIKEKAKINHYPGSKELEGKFKISFRTYFKDIREVYNRAAVDYSLAKTSIKNRILASHTYSEDVLGKQKESIKKFIQESVAKGIYPSVNYIQNKLSLSFYNLYDDILQAYKEAGIEYNRPSPILLGKEKEKIFTGIVKILLVKMGFTIKRVSIESKIKFNRYADITVKDKDGKLCLVEIKAYREDYCITKREFFQLLKYLEKERIPKGIFITTSNTRECSFGEIQFINGRKVIELLKEYKLMKYARLIRWVQEARINSNERKKHVEAAKKEIFEYMRGRRDVPTKKEIQKIFRIDLRSLFGEVRPYEKLLDEATELGTLQPRV